MISRFLQGLIFITIKINFGDLGNEIEIKQKMPTKCNFFYLGNEKELPENQGKIRNQTRIQSEKKNQYL